MSIKIGSSDGKVLESVVMIPEGFSHSFSFPQAAFNELLKTQYRCQMKKI